MTSINSLSLVKSKSYYKKFFFSWRSFSDQQQRHLCFKMDRLDEVLQNLYSTRDEFLDILETFKEQHEAVHDGLFTWREGAPAKRATRLTELPWEG